MNDARRWLPRVRRISTELARPADTWLAARIFCWVALVRVAKYAVPLQALVKIVSPVPRSGSRNANREQRIALFADWASRVVRPRSDGNCLERSLVAYRYMIRAHANPRLVIGFRRGDSGMLGHAWVLVDGEPLSDSPASVAEYHVAMSFEPGGCVMTDLAR
jgi:transglutaminase superfamily protein